MLQLLAIAVLTAAPPIPIPPLPVGQTDWGVEAIKEAEFVERRLARHGFAFEGDARACLWAHLLLTTARGLGAMIGTLASRDSTVARLRGAPTPDRSTYSPDVQTRLHRAIKQLERTRDEKCGGPPSRQLRKGTAVTNSANPGVQEALEWLHDHPTPPKTDPAKLVVQAWWHYMVPVPRTVDEALEAGVLFAGSIVLMAMSPAEVSALLALVSAAP